MNKIELQLVAPDEKLNENFDDFIQTFRNEILQKGLELKENDPENAIVDFFIGEKYKCSFDFRGNFVKVINRKKSNKGAKKWQ